MENLSDQKLVEQEQTIIGKWYAWIVGLIKRPECNGEMHLPKTIKSVAIDEQVEVRTL